MTQIQDSITKQLNDRFLRIMGRHLDDNDILLSDRDLVFKVYDRYNKYLQQEIVDVNE